MVICFLQLDNSIAKVCSSLESVKQHDATYMLNQQYGFTEVCCDS